MSITFHIHHVFKKLMHERRDFALVWEVDLNQMRVMRLITSTHTFPTWACWLWLWNMCILMMSTDMLLERRLSLSWPYKMFHLLWCTVCIYLEAHQSAKNPPLGGGHAWDAWPCVGRMEHARGVCECSLVHKCMFLRPFWCLLPYKISWDQLPQ